MRFRSLPISHRYPMLLGLLLLVTLLCTATPVSDEHRLRQALDRVRQGELAQAMKVLGPLKTSATMTPTFGRLVFLRATVAQQLQDADSARRALTLVWLAYPPLADYAAWELVQDASQRDDLPALRAMVAALGAQYPDSLWLPESQLLLAQTQHRLGQARQAQGTMETFLRTHPSHASVPHALWLQAQLAEDGGDLAHAARILRRLGEAHPRHALAATALSRSRQLLATLPLSQRPARDPEQELATLERLIPARQWPEVEARLGRLQQAQMPAKLASRLLLTRAVAAQQRRQRREAISLLNRFLLRYPKSPGRAEAHYRLAQLYSRQGKHTESETHYRHAAAQKGDAIWAPKALLDLARRLVQRDNLAAASQVYRQLGERFPKHDEAIASLSQAAWLQYRLGRYRQAGKLWRLAIRQFPDNPWRPQGLYWLARMAQHQRQRAKAQALYERVVIDYPLHYYSVHAREQLRQLGLTLPAVAGPERLTLPWKHVTPVSLSTSSQSPPTREQFHLIRVREFQQLQMYKKARGEINALAALLPEDHASRYFLAELFVDSRDYLAAFHRLNRILKTLSPVQVRRLPRAFWSMLYPKAFWQQVLPEARTYGLSPYLLLSLIRQESAFNPRAVSRAGARGLMQLMPATARIVARQVRLRPFKLRMLFEPQRNIPLGTHFFAEQLRRFQGNRIFALAAYNAGPNRVDRWRKRWPILPMDEFVEHIPFDETRLYVKLILRNMLVYEYLYQPVSDA